MKPTVSVIVGTYNRATSLAAAIRSVSGQSFHDFELIVVDDGSTDGTRELVSSLADPRVRYIYQENQGLPAAWNVGTESSRGELLAFLDSDDVWLDHKLEKQVALLRQPGTRYAACVTGYLLQSVRGGRTPIIPTPEETTSRAILWKNVLHLGTTLMCSAQIFSQVGRFDENLRRGQDTDWLIRYRDRYEIGIVPEVLAVFNQHLARSGRVMEQSRLYFLDKHRARMLEEGRPFYRRKVAGIYRELAYQFSREGEARKAQAYARQALSLSPSLAPGLWLLLLDSFLGTRSKRALDSIRYGRTPT